MLDFAGGKLFTKRETAKKLKTTTRSLDRWHLERSGPPRTTVGRVPYYSEQGLDAWMQMNEIRPLARRKTRRAK